MDKETVSSEEDLIEKLGPGLDLWNELKAFITEQYPGAGEKWNFPGKKYGWRFQMHDKKRAIMYFLPGDGYFKVAFVFGQKATDQILLSDISSEIKEELMNARKYAEGRSIRIDILNDEKISDIHKLIEIKLAN